MNQANPTTPHLPPRNGEPQANALPGTAGLRPVRVAVIDSGIDTTHPLLAGTQLLHDLAWDTAPAPFGDVCGHGTEVAAIIRTLAPHCQLGSFRVLAPDLSAQPEAIRAAALHAVALGYEILNLSLADGSEGAELLHTQWVAQAVTLGVHVVAAGSNVDARRPQFPAMAPGAIAVVAAEHVVPESTPTALLRLADPPRLAASGMLAPIPDASALKPGAGSDVVQGEAEAEPGDSEACASLATARVTAALALLLGTRGPMPPADATALIFSAATPAEDESGAEAQKCAVA
ncbi:hypothetical protein DB346_12205 [Verrucomicrobia bacterium LW23]|nr:hypothetical protein DB346_12205 [Verrucomicrobia bacterium LW23]